MNSSLRQKLMRTIGAAVLLAVVGCGETGPSPAVVEATRLMQLNKAQDALDALRNDRSAEGLYLRALALEHLESRDVARVELERAIKKDPKNTKYRGLLLRLDLFRGEDATADAIISLYRQSDPSAATSVFAVYAYEARSVRARAKGSKGSAEADHSEALKALQTAVALSAEAPEFQPEMLVFAMRFKEPRAAQAIIEKLEAADPENLDLTQERISVAMMLNNTDEARQLAQKKYHSDQRNEQVALQYAAVLSKAPLSPQTDEAFAALREKFPANTQIIMREAIYFTRSNRLQEACKMLNDLLEKTDRQANNRIELISLAIDLPLEAGDATLAEWQLEKHRPEIFETAICTYFDGRLAYLKKKYDVAGQKMVEVLQTQKDEATTSRALAYDALIWARRILADKLVAEQLEAASETIKPQIKPKLSKEELLNRLTNQGAESGEPKEKSNDDAKKSAPEKGANNADPMPQETSSVSGQ